MGWTLHTVEHERETEGDNVRVWLSITTAAICVASISTHYEYPFGGHAAGLYPPQGPLQLQRPRGKKDSYFTAAESVGGCTHRTSNTTTSGDSHRTQRDERGAGLRAHPSGAVDVYK